MFKLLKFKIKSHLSFNNLLTFFNSIFGICYVSYDKKKADIKKENINITNIQ